MSAKQSIVYWGQARLYSVIKVTFVLQKLASPARYVPVWVILIDISSPKWPLKCPRNFRSSPWTLPWPRNINWTVRYCAVSTQTLGLVHSRREVLAVKVFASSIDMRRVRRLVRLGVLCFACWSTGYCVWPSASLAKRSLSAGTWYRRLNFYRY